MCTVTFLPLSEKGFVLTSSRDVGYQREEAIAPQTYVEDGVILHYPKDGKAGGTWIGTSRNNRLICLLNGGFKNHLQQNSYAKSRGLIVKELLVSIDLEAACKEIDLLDIEPFTITAVTWSDKQRLFQFVWDGSNRFFKEMDWKPTIWSSSTLYTDEMKAMRQGWFLDWLEENKGDAASILKFHQNAGIGDPEVDVFMKRERVGTVSITQVIESEEKDEMHYYPF
jgi:hypothetical protein